MSNVDVTSDCQYENLYKYFFLSRNFIAIMWNVTEYKAFRSYFLESESDTWHF